MDIRGQREPSRHPDHHGGDHHDQGAAIFSGPVPDAPASQPDTLFQDNENAQDHVEGDPGA